MATRKNGHKILGQNGHTWKKSKWPQEKWPQIERAIKTGENQNGHTWKRSKWPQGKMATNRKGNDKINLEFIV